MARNKKIAGEDFVLYRRWLGIKRRCFNKNRPEYKNYGGRGISICDRWLSFYNFKEDMGSSYEKELSLDRIDNNGNYCKENCRWTDNRTQANNSRKVLNATKISYMGITDVVSNWAKYLGIKRRTISQRIKYGWPVEKILFEPVKNKYINKNV